jgi:hypothetical protein
MWDAVFPKMLSVAISPTEKEYYVQSGVREKASIHPREKPTTVLHRPLPELEAPAVASSCHK